MEFWFVRVVARYLNKLTHKVNLSMCWINGDVIKTCGHNRSDMCCCSAHLRTLINSGQGESRSGGVTAGEVRNHDTGCPSVVSFTLRSVTPKIITLVPTESRGGGGCLGPSASLLEASARNRPAINQVIMLTDRFQFPVFICCLFNNFSSSSNCVMLRINYFILSVSATVINLESWALRSPGMLCGVDS